MIFSIIRAKTFRTRKNFPGSNATLLPGFLGLCLAYMASLAYMTYLAYMASPSSREIGRQPATLASSFHLDFD